MLNESTNNMFHILYKAINMVEQITITYSKDHKYKSDYVQFNMCNSEEKYDAYEILTQELTILRLNINKTSRQIINPILAIVFEKMVLILTHPIF